MNDFPVQYKKGKIHVERDGTCVISFQSQWIDGVYENQESAELAIDCLELGNESLLIRMWEKQKPSALSKIDVQQCLVKKLS